MNKNKLLNNGQIAKEAHISNMEMGQNDMDLINKHTLEPLTEDQVYTFKVKVADNQVDRDFERFTIKALNGLADLFVGKPLIKDHERSANNQVGRVFDTYIETDEARTVDENGEPYTALMAKCYVLETESNTGLISEIKGGIKKEVSLNAGLTEMNCSICGVNNVQEACSHWWGNTYEGKKCYFNLNNPVDAYEISFVAVGAQQEAGVMKRLGGVKDDRVAEKEKTQDDTPNLRLAIKLAEHETFILKNKGAITNE